MKRNGLTTSQLSAASCAEACAAGTSIIRAARRRRRHARPWECASRLSLVMGLTVIRAVERETARCAGATAGGRQGAAGGTHSTTARAPGGTLFSASLERLPTLHFKVEFTVVYIPLSEHSWR